MVRTGEFDPHPAHDIFNAEHRIIDLMGGHPQLADVAILGNPAFQSGHAAPDQIQFFPVCGSKIIAIGIAGLFHKALKPVAQVFHPVALGGLVKLVGCQLFRQIGWDQALVGVGGKDHARICQGTGHMVVHKIQLEGARIALTVLAKICHSPLNQGVGNIFIIAAQGSQGIVPVPRTLRHGHLHGAVDISHDHQAQDIVVGGPNPSHTAVGAGMGQHLPHGFGHAPLGGVIFLGPGGSQVILNGSYLIPKVIQPHDDFRIMGVVEILGIDPGHGLHIPIAHHIIGTGMDPTDHRRAQKSIIPQSQIRIVKGGV